MRILILQQFPIYGGGSGTYTRKLALSLRKDGHDVAIVAPDTRELKGVKTYTIKPAYKAVFISHPEYKRAIRYSQMTGTEFSKQYGSYLKYVTEAVNDFKPDVIHVNHASFLAWIASMIKEMCGIAYVVTVHGTGIFNSTIDPRYRYLTRQALNHADFIISVSYHTRKWMFKVFGQGLKRKTKVIPNGISLTDFSKNVSVKSIEKKYKINGRKLVLFVGRLTWEKGVEYLIKAAKGIDAEVFIIGGGTYEKYLKNYAKLLNIKNVRFLGYLGRDNIEDLRAMYCRADVLVLPSVVEESTGYVILEAMACGTPVVASNKGGIPIVVKEGYNGHLIRVKSPKAITRAVNDIINNPVIAKKFAENSRKIIEEKFNWGVLTPQTVEIYKRVGSVTKKMQERRKKMLFEKDTINRERGELEKKIDD